MLVDVVSWSWHTQVTWILMIVACLCVWVRGYFLFGRGSSLSMSKQDFEEVMVDFPAERQQMLMMAATHATPARSALPSKLRARHSPPAAASSFVDPEHAWRHCSAPPSPQPYRETPRPLLPHGSRRQVLDSNLEGGWGIETTLVWEYVLRMLSLQGCSVMICSTGSNLNPRRFPRIRHVCRFVAFVAVCSRARGEHVRVTHFRMETASASQ